MLNTELPINTDLGTARPDEVSQGNERVNEDAEQAEEDEDDHVGRLDETKLAVPHFGHLLLTV
jgi:hypothetical protein